MTDQPKPPCPHDGGDHIEHRDGVTVVVCNACGTVLAAGELPDEPN